MSHIIRPYKSWERPATAVYEDNYGYGINYYQPMIDYLNAKERGHSVEPPHLPWNNERALPAYRPGNRVRCYSEQELGRLAREAAEHAKSSAASTQYQVLRRSAFSVTKAASAVNVTKHVGTESAVTRTKGKINRRNLAAFDENRRNEHLLRMQQAVISSISEDEEFRNTAKMLRGKSAKSIADTLVTRSLKNISDATEMDAMNIKTFESHQKVAAHNARVYTKMMETKTTSHLDESFLQPLTCLKCDLKTFDHKSTNYFMDTRLKYPSNIRTYFHY